MKNPHVDRYGTKYWCNEKGQLHRINGPATICADGRREWYQNGKLHRDDGPAIVFDSGYSEWYIHGKLVKPQPKIIGYLRKKLKQ